MTYLHTSLFYKWIAWFRLQSIDHEVVLIQNLLFLYFLPIYLVEIFLESATKSLTWLLQAKWFVHIIILVALWAPFMLYFFFIKIFLKSIRVFFCIFIIDYHLVIEVTEVLFVIDVSKVVLYDMHIIIINLIISDCSRNLLSVIQSRTADKHLQVLFLFLYRLIILWLAFRITLHLWLSLFFAFTFHWWFIFHRFTSFAVRCLLRWFRLTALIWYQNMWSLINVLEVSGSSLSLSGYQVTLFHIERCCIFLLLKSILFLSSFLVFRCVEYLHQNLLWALILLVNAQIGIGLIHLLFTIKVFQILKSIILFIMGRILLWTIQAILMVFLERVNLNTPIRTN